MKDQNFLNNQHQPLRFNNEQSYFFKLTLYVLGVIKYVVLGISSLLEKDLSFCPEVKGEEVAE